MNCRECNLVLDTHAPDALTAAQRAAVDAHLGSCADCRADWANWRSVAALAIPSTPPELRARIAALLPAEAGRSAAAVRRPGRVFVVGGLLIAGAALAAMFALQPAQEPQPLADRPSVQSIPSIEEAPPTARSMPGNAESSTPSEVAAASSDAGSEVDAAFEGGLDSRSVVVFIRPEAAAGTVEIAEATKCHDAIIEQLQAIVGLNVIAGTRVSSFDGSNRDDWEIARALGAGNLLHLGTENGCNARLHHARSSDPWESRITGLTYGGRYPGTDGWLGFALTVADSVRESLLENPATRVVEAQANVLNTALGDRQRIYALQDLREGVAPIPSAFERGVVAAAAQIAISSSDPDARARAWVHLRGVDDPFLIAPLLQSLATDTDEDVRMQAALTLRTFIDQPGVREALLHAAAEDPSSEPYVPCCVPTVREAAEWATVATGDLPAWARGKLLDESLPTRSRLFWLGAGLPDGRFVRVSDLIDDVQPIVFEIGRNETDPIWRSKAWGALYGASHPEFVPVLLDDLRNHPDEYVRASAGFALSPYIDQPEVLAAIEAAVNDPSMEVRRMAGNELSRAGR